MIEENGRPHIEPRTVFGWCAWCEHEIEPAEPCVTVSVNVEEDDLQLRSSGEPEVEQLTGERVLSLCKECGEVLDGSSVRAALYEHYRGGVSLRAAIGWWLLTGGRS